MLQHRDNPPRRARPRGVLALGLTLAASCVAVLGTPIADTQAADVWSDPMDLSAAGGTGTVPQVASSPDGDAVAIWLRTTDGGTTNVVEAREYDSETGAWSATETLSTGSDTAQEPTVEVDASGNAFAAWRGLVSGNYIVQVRRYEAATGNWGPSTDLSASGANARGPELSVDPQGNFTAAWYRFVSGRTRVQTKRYDVGAGSWSATPATLDDAGDAADAADGSRVPRVAAGADGSVIAIWSQQVDASNNPASRVIRFAQYTVAQGDWSAPGSVVPDAEAGPIDGTSLQLAVDPAGNATAIWTRASAGGYGIVQTSRFSVATGTWSASENRSADGGTAVGPRVGVDEAGNVTAVWRHDDAAGKSIVQASRFTATTATWSAVQDLSAAGRSTQSPRVAVEPQGNVTAVWLRNDGANLIVQSARYSLATGTWGAATDLSAPGADGLTPQTDVDNQGDVVVVWARSNGTDTIIQASISSRVPGFTPVAPVRVFDTRGESPDALRVVPTAKVGGATELRVKFADLQRAGVAITPATGVAAVSMNVAVTNPVGDGFVTVYPCGTRQLVASVNFVAGQTVSNAVIAPVSAEGDLCFYAYAATDIVVDLNGWFPVGSSFNAVAPSRVFDTRGESPNALRQVPVAKVRPNQPLEVSVASLGALTPATGIGAVSLNVAVTNPEAAGFVTVYPCGNRPFTASGNYVAGQTVSNAVIAPVSATGTICFYSLQPTDIVVDINGWFTAGSGFTAAGPARVFDSRGESPNALVTVPKAKVSPTNELKVKVTDLKVSDTDTITPPIGVGAVSLNVAVANPEADGFITVYPCGQRQLVASVNYVKGQVVPNAVIAPVSADGYVCFYSYAPADVIVDINGWFPVNA